MGIKVKDISIPVDDNTATSKIYVDDLVSSTNTNTMTYIDSRDNRVIDIISAANVTPYTGLTFLSGITITETLSDKKVINISLGLQNNTSNTVAISEGNAVISFPGMVYSSITYYDSHVAYSGEYAQCYINNSATGGITSVRPRIPLSIPAGSTVWVTGTIIVPSV